jgi:hypothetical protein
MPRVHGILEILQMMVALHFIRSLVIIPEVHHIRIRARVSSMNSLGLFGIRKMVLVVHDLLHHRSHRQNIREGTIYLVLLQEAFTLRVAVRVQVHILHHVHLSLVTLVVAGRKGLCHHQPLSMLPLSQFLY